MTFASAGAGAAGVLVAGLVVTGAPASAYDAVFGDDQGTGVQIDTTTADGKTLGRLSPGDQPIKVEDLPDGFFTYADNGKPGYVLRADLDPFPPPKSPEEALAQEAEAKKPRAVNVYAEDGATVVGQVTLNDAQKRAAAKR